MFPLVALSHLPILFFIHSCSAEEPPYTSFAKDATSAPPQDYYDYIVIGGGTAGCPLAATLSSAAKVLLLERGGLPYNNPKVTHISGFGATLLDNSPTSASQMFVSTDGVYNHRARILGGGSAINAGFFTRAGSQEVVDAGWDPQLVEMSYEWVERKVASWPRVASWQAAVRDGLLEAAGVLPDNGFTYEHLVGTKIGGSIFDENGYRHSAADLLEYVDSTKITVYLQTDVHQILFKTSPGQKPNANGVLFKDSNGISHVAYLNSGPKNEIILSAGALGSPQLLMLSGIGPAHQLLAHGIGVVLDQPMVGQGMSDNPMNAILIPTPKDVEISLVQTVGITEFGSYVEAASRLIEQALNSTLGQQFAKIVNQIIHPLRPDETIQDLIISEKVNGPFSTGYLELQSTDPNDNPSVTFNYFQDPRDLNKCVQGMEIIRKVVKSAPASRFQYPFTSFTTLMNLMLALPTNLRTRSVITSTFSMEQFCRDTVLSIWHYHGGCQVNRVVDRAYKVIGVDGLRVVDGSTFYNSPGTNPQATVMMLGRYVGQKILQERTPN